MNRKIYQPTAAQEQKWALMKAPPMPTDDEFRAMWKKAHHGKVAGWGIGKRDWIVSNMKNTREYQTGIWQGRVDAANKLDYQEPQVEAENANCYNLGYYRGYASFASDARGWDSETRAQFFATYVS